MNGGTAAPGIDARPSPQDRCAACGEAIDDAWVSYRQSAEDPQRLIAHFGGIIRRGPAEPPQAKSRNPNTRDFKYPEDLGVFFHSECAPRVKVPEAIQDEFAKVIAQAVWARCERMVARWARVRPPASGDADPPRCRAHVGSCEKRRVFTIARADWKEVRTHEGKLVEIDLERAPTDGVSGSASRIVCLAAECSVETERIEVWRYNEKAPPRLKNIERYLVLENLTRRLNLPMFAERVGTEDSPELRKYLRDRVFIVRERLDKGRWEPKARAVDRLVFLCS